MARRKRRVWRHPDAVRLPAIQRVRNGEPLAVVARDIDVHRRLLADWVAQALRLEEGVAARPPVSKDRDGLRRENQQLKQALADKTLELDFFKGALQKIEARRQARGKTGETASTPRFGK